MANNPNHQAMAPAIDNPKDNLTVVLYGVKDIRFEQTPIPQQIDANDALLETICVGICGSDVHYWQKGRIGDFVLEKPMILGHETCAIVRQVGSAVTHLVPGQRVAVEPGQSCSSCDFCKKGRYNLCAEMKFHATPPYNGSLRRYFVHPAHLCFPLPDNVDSESGACVEPLAVGIHACNRSRLACGHTVLVCGAGPIGLVSMLAAKAFGAASVCITDMNEQRLQLAKQLGADHTILIQKGEDNEAVARRARETIGVEGFDRTFECCGAETSICIAISATKPGGVMVLVGMGPLEVKVPLISAASREVDIVGVFRYANCYPQAIKLLTSNKISLKSLVTHRYPLEQSVEAFEKAKSGEAIKVIITCQQSV